MPNMSCSTEEFISKSKKCCPLCPAGQYLIEECSETKERKCAACVHNHYIESPNRLDKCIRCETCDGHSRVVRNCTAAANTVCECESGYYKNPKGPDHCLPWSSCPVGHGVKQKASRTNDTVCTECINGTFSNVTDYTSPCKPHFRCDDYGRKILTPGNSTHDAVCGNQTSVCSWMLPAGLWAGLLLTLSIVAILVLCRLKWRRSKRKAKVSVPVDLLEIIPAPGTGLSEQDSLFQKCCECEKKLFQEDVHLVTEDSSCPIKFVSQPHHFQCSGSFERMISEPQEDEYREGS